MFWVSFYVSEIYDVEKTLVWNGCQDVERDVETSEVEHCDAGMTLVWYRCQDVRSDVESSETEHCDAEMTWV
jgi:hypothetical protein